MDYMTLDWLNSFHAPAAFVSLHSKKIPRLQVLLVPLWIRSGLISGCLDALELRAWILEGRGPDNCGSTRPALRSGLGPDAGFRHCCGADVVSRAWLVSYLFLFTQHWVRYRGSDVGGDGSETVQTFLHDKHGLSNNSVWAITPNIQVIWQNRWDWFLPSTFTPTFLRF